MTRIPGWTDEEILHETLVEPRRALVLLPGAQVVEREGWWQLVTASLRQGGMNEVGFCSVGEGEADRVIDETIARYRALGIRFRWNVVPGSRPADLGARLAARGLAEKRVRAMAIVTRASPRDPRVEEVTAANVDDFTRVMAEGWEMDPGPFDLLHRMMLADPGRRHRPFLGRVSSRPVGAASYALLPRSAYLMGAVVLPELRKQGIFRAIV